MREGSRGPAARSSSSFIGWEYFALGVHANLRPRCGDAGSSRNDRPKAAPPAVPWCGGSSRNDRPKAAPPAVPWCGGS